MSTQANALRRTGLRSAAWPHRDWLALDYAREVLDASRSVIIGNRLTSDGYVVTLRVELRDGDALVVARVRVTVDADGACSHVVEREEAATCSEPRQTRSETRGRLRAQ